MTREEAMKWLKHCAFSICEDCVYEIQPIEWCHQKMQEAVMTIESADAEHDGCDGCRYEHNTEYEYPCSECKQNHVDMWEQKPNDFIEVVRCKDCKYSFYDKDYESYNCRKHEYVECFDANDYCSWGERND